MFAYCDVRASQSIHENKDLWIVFRKKPKTNTDILSAWCSCMAGAYNAWNHVLATLFKTEYANDEGWCSQSCTKNACQWNQSTKNDIEPKRITGLFVRKSLRMKQEDTCETSRGETRTKHLLEFHLRIESQRILPKALWIIFGKV